MERMPRNAKFDSLVTNKVIFHSYFENGFVQSFAAFYTWVYVLNDYGFRPSATIFIALEEGYYPEASDVYDANQPNFGNSNFGKGSNLSTLFWDGETDAEMDLRLFYQFRNKDQWTKCRWDPQDESVPRFWSYSDVTGKQICYTVEANKYA